MVRARLIFACIVGVFTASASAAESPYIYGIHDYEPSPQVYLDHITAGGASGWVTATVAIGNDPNDHSGGDFSALANQGHTVIVRLNNGYCPNGTIPPSDRYDEFAQRAANYVTASKGASIWLIGNETNLASEWPIVNGRLKYVSPEDYATLFRQVYAAIKGVKPDHKVLSQALAPFAGPYGDGSTCGYSHDGNPLNWVQYMNDMLSAIESTGNIDGIALHVNSRGYTYSDIHNNEQVYAGGQYLYWSFYVYKDWIDYGIPSNLYHLPLYITETNGIYYWSGGHPEDTNAHYEEGWMQEIYAEINRYNQTASLTGDPIIRCVNPYRWCSYCDAWNIDGSPYESAILADLDDAVSINYLWPSSAPTGDLEGENVALGSSNWKASSVYDATYGGDLAYDGVISVESKWTSSGSSASSWLALELADIVELTGFIVHHAGSAGEPYYYNTQTLQLESGSSLEGPWSVLKTVDNSAQENASTVVLEDRISSRYVRLSISDAGIDNYARIPEFEVYAVAAAPTAVIEAEPLYGEPPLKVTFDATLSQGSSLTYDWDFGDGTSGTGVTIEHIYEQEGIFIAALKTTDSDGDFDSATVAITVEEQASGCGVNGLW